MQTIDRKQLKQRMGKDEPFLLIDVLGPDHYREGHLPDAISIPLKSEHFVDRVEEKAGGKEMDIIVYCANTDCDASPRAAKELEEAGFKNVYDFEAGLEGWEKTGEPVVATATA
ncbi:MAG: rhodanese-like domain-containing protein [Candidatus Omnitrophica bacterium]|nr:rhodanese-like domain-containing protein [Candidatus Omnitrophota bacterium]